MVLIETALKKIERGKARAADLEGQKLDFKQTSPTKKETFKVVTDACVCFANAGGGQIVLGVSDTLTGPDALLGTSIVDSELRKAVHQRTEPPLLVGVETITHSGARLLVVDVPEGVQVHSNSQGVSTRRVEDECRPMRPEQIARLEEERSGRDWSAMPSGRKVADVDQEAERHLYGFLRSSSRDSVTRLARLGRSELLRELNLVTTSSELNRQARYFSRRRSQDRPRSWSISTGRHLLARRTTSAAGWGPS